MNIIRSLIERVADAFRMRTPLELAVNELEEARRDLLGEMSRYDYSKRMVQYHEDRISRLNRMVNEGLSR